VQLPTVSGIELLVSGGAARDYGRHCGREDLGIGYAVGDYGAVLDLELNGRYSLDGVAEAFVHHPVEGVDVELGQVD